MKHIIYFLTIAIIVGSFMKKDKKETAKSK